MQDNIFGPEAVKGEVRFCKVGDRGRSPGGFRSVFSVDSVVPNLIGGKQHDVSLPGYWHWRDAWQHNDVLYEWATIVGELLRNAPDKKPYHLGGMFIEFENNGGAAVSPPVVARDEASSYYNGLLTHPNRDYLRVAMTAQTLTSTDDVLFPNGNRVTNFAQTSGTTGVHGKTFSAGLQSRIYGAALVAFPDFGDATQDLVLSRFYYDDTDNQMIKIDGSEVGVEWRLNLL